MITVILVRHADIDIPPPMVSDISLNAAGLIRAAELARVLENAGVGRIFTSNALRTRQTAAPLAAKLAITPTERDWDPPAVASLRTGTDGNVVLIVGHSNTIPGIVQQLTETSAPISVGGFDNLLVVSVEGASASLLRLKYGD